MTFSAAEDKAKYGSFRDYGIHWQTTYKGRSIPPGYWVYVYPNWYIWKTNVEQEKQRTAARERQEDHSRDLDLNAEMHTQWPYLTITNRDNFDWKDVKLTIYQTDSALSSPRYEFKLDRIRANETLRLNSREFTKDGVRFEYDKIKPYAISILSWDGKTYGWWMRAFK